MNIAVRTIDRPQFSQYLAGEGGVFAGVMRGENGQPDYLLIVYQEQSAAAPWQQKMDWAKGLEADGHKDFRLPTRREMRVLYANAKDLFKEEWYWTSEQHASNPDFAWVQHFDNGYQTNYREGNYYRARAVRSVILQ